MDNATHFQSILEDFNSALWGHHFCVPEAIARPFIEGDNRRVVCTINGSAPFQCALMPKGDGSFFINVNKKLRDKYKLKLGATLEVSLCKDESRYGLPMPEEFEELLAQDEEGDRLFHGLTPGKQRTLLYYIGQPKTADTRLVRAVAVVEHLKANGGKVDFNILMRSS